MGDRSRAVIADPDMPIEQASAQAMACFLACLPDGEYIRLARRFRGDLSGQLPSLVDLKGWPAR
jgi:hypothetical protein